MKKKNILKKLYKFADNLYDSVFLGDSYLEDETSRKEIEAMGPNRKFWVPFLFLLYGMCIFCIANSKIIDTLNGKDVVFIAKEYLIGLIVMVLMVLLWRIGFSVYIESLNDTHYFISSLMGVLCGMFWILFDSMRKLFSLNYFKINFIFSLYMTIIYPLIIMLLFKSRGFVGKRKLYSGLVILFMIITSTIRSLEYPEVSFLLVCFMNIAPLVLYMVLIISDRTKSMQNIILICVVHCFFEVLIRMVYNVIKQEDGFEEISSAHIWDAGHALITDIPDERIIRFIRLPLWGDILLHVIIVSMFLAYIIMSVRKSLHKSHGIIVISIASYFVIKMIFGIYYMLFGTSFAYTLIPFQYYDVVIDSFLFLILFWNMISDKAYIREYRRAYN